jgi:hypothetical protein
LLERVGDPAEAVVRAAMRDFLGPERAFGDDQAVATFAIVDFPGLPQSLKSRMAEVMGSGTCAIIGALMIQELG